MTVTLNLLADQVAALRDGFARHNAEAVGRILLESLNPPIEEIIEDDLTGEPGSVQTMDEYDLWLEDLDAYISSIMGPEAPTLSDYAVSREGIYGDYP